MGPLQVWFYLSLCYVATPLVRSVEECGLSPKADSISYRIVGGQAALPGEWPWQISLQIELRLNEFSHLCGATLLNERWILTAAHCFRRYPFGYRIVLGEHNLARNDGTEVYRRGEKIVQHPNYNVVELHSDFALVKLSEPLDLAGNHSHLTPICIPDNNTKVDETDCMATGWGDLIRNGRNPNILQEVNMPIRNQEECETIYSFLKINVTSDMLCAGSFGGGYGVCHGDSGGPLKCKMRNKWYQVGITSWSFGCAEKFFPSVFARVSSARDWIVETVKNQ